MKQILPTIFGAFCVMTVSAQAPYAEPDFIGEVIVVHADGTSAKLDKSTVQINTKIGAGALIAGIGKAKTKITLDGPRAMDRFRQGEDFSFIVKAMDNESDPMSIINIIKFQASKKDRKAELESLSTFGSHKTNKLELLRYEAKKYGKNSYLIVLKDKILGEFGITVRNPNEIDEKSMIVSTFAIDE